MIGVTTSPTLMDTTTDHTASELPGIGAVTIVLGTGMPGHIIVLGDSTDGVSTTAGSMILGTTAGSMILGTTEVPGVSTTLGIMADITVDFMVAGMEVGMVTRTMPAGMEV